MKRLRILGTGGGRTSAHTLFVPSMTWAIIALAQPAHAELGPMFSSTITVDPEYATGVDGVTDIAFAADGRAVITRKSGQVVIRRTNGTLATLSNLFPGLDTSIEKGLLGVVADPNVAMNNTFYFYVSNGSDENDKHRVVKGVLTAQDTITIDPMPVIAASRNNGPGLAGPANHNGGGLVIHKGQLYVGVGDTGNNATPPVNKFGSCLNKPNGKILRVNLDGSVPTDNPLVGKSSVTACEKATSSFATGTPDTRIFAWGFRNPWRIWVDPMTDLLWVGDVGEQTSEEISVGKGGQHYGFPFVEGSMTYKDVGGLNCTTMTPAVPCTPPAYAYPWDEGGGKGSVSGGLIPSGCGWEKAMGGTRYLFGDYVKNWVRALTVNPARDGVTGTAVPFDTHKSSTGPVSFRMGPDEALYIAYYGADAVYRYAPTDRTGCSMGGTGGAGGGGAGGSGGGGTAMGGAKSGGSGGTPAGGTPAMGGSPASGAAGSANMAGVAGTTLQGGTPGTAGSSVGGSSPGAGGSVIGAGGSASPASPKDDGGCGCRVANRNAGLAAAGLLVGVAVGGAWRRQRRRQTPPRRRG